jgi:predicted nucleotidyltransferase
MITSGQQLFINKALPILKRDKRIVGVALEGSYIRKETMDEFSGLDFVLAVDPASYDEVMAERVELASKLGVLLASFPGEHIHRPELLICLYDEPLMHVDLFFMRPEDASNRYEDPTIMYQTGGALSDVFAKTPSRTPRPDLQWFEDRFWLWVHYAATRIGRGELFDAIRSIDFLRVEVLGPLIQMQAGSPPRGVRYIERDAPEHISRLAETIAAYDTDSCVRALKASANLYIALRGVNKASLFLRDKAEERALGYLNDIAERVKERA